MRPDSTRHVERGPSRTALILIDVINDMNFAAGRKLLRFALPAAQKIKRLKERALAHGVPCIYVNDNFGKWRSDFRAQVAHCKSPNSTGKEIVSLLEPGEKEYFVLKPMHSAFYSTSLTVLLNQLQTKHLVITGFATNLCVLFTVSDAYMRNFKLTVPHDCVAAEEDSTHRFALAQIKNYLGVRTCASKDVRF